MSQFSFTQGQNRLTVSIVELLPNTGIPALEIVTELGALDDLVDEPELLVNVIPLDNARYSHGAYSTLKSLVVEAFAVASERGIRCRIDGNIKGANICAEQKTVLTNIVDFIAENPEYRGVLLGFNV